MNILLTGAAGFIGINLATSLLDEGHSVVGIDNFYSSEKKKIEHLLQQQNFHLIKKDITETWKSFHSEIGKIDAICNFACPASPPVYLKDPVYTAKVSIFGILNALEYATEHNVPLMHASTSEVYGDPLEHPQRETYYGNVNPIGIRSCYDEGKRIAESFCFDYKRKYNTTVKIVRIFNTYGPFMKRSDGRVISNFINAALTGTPLPIYGDGSQTRSFCFIDDLVAGLKKFLFLPDAEQSGPINLGNTAEISIKEVSELMLKSYPHLELSYEPIMENDPKMRKPDISLASKLLDWMPRVSLEEGLDKTIKWFSDFYA